MNLSNRTLASCKNPMVESKLFPLSGSFVEHTPHTNGDETGDDVGNKEQTDVSVDVFELDECEVQ
eukprot:Pgem_evm1s2061